MQPLANRLKQKLLQKNEAGLYRQRFSIHKRRAARINFNTKTDSHLLTLSFLNNDYLGLATDRKVIEALEIGAKKYGVGSSASPFLGGHYKIHEELEEALRDFTGQERVVLFPTGYMANLAALTALLNKDDILLEDRLNHASLIDAGLFSKAKLIRYPHKDICTLENILKRYHDQVKWIVSDGVFSMEGDLAPLDELVELAKKFRAGLMIDDAHGLGVLGQKGGGIIEYFKINPNDINLLVGTFGKSFGTQGAFIAGNHLLIETILQFSRNYIYSTAFSPAMAFATLRSLELLQNEPWRRVQLQTLIHRFRMGAKNLGFILLPSETPIQALVLGRLRLK